MKLRLESQGRPAVPIALCGDDAHEAIAFVKGVGVDAVLMVFEIDHPDCTLILGHIKVHIAIIRVTTIHCSHYFHDAVVATSHIRHIRKKIEVAES